VIQTRHGSSNPSAPRLLLFCYSRQKEHMVVLLLSLTPSCSCDRDCVAFSWFLILHPHCKKTKIPLSTSPSTSGQVRAERHFLPVIILPPSPLLQSLLLKTLCPGCLSLYTRILTSRANCPTAHALENSFVARIPNQLKGAVVSRDLS